MGEEQTLESVSFNSNVLCLRNFRNHGSHEDQNRPGNSVAGLSNLQMRALNDSFSNLINTGLEQIHQRLDELQVSQSHPRLGTRTNQP